MTAGSTPAPVPVQRRSLPGWLRCLAEQLRSGKPSAAVAITLEVMAEELEQPGHMEDHPA